jgi:hypothetical protein
VEAARDRWLPLHPALRLLPPPPPPALLLPDQRGYCPFPVRWQHAQKQLYHALQMQHGHNHALQQQAQVLSADKRAPHAAWRQLGWVLPGDSDYLRFEETRPRTEVAEEGEEAEEAEGGRADAHGPYGGSPAPQLWRRHQYVE